MPAISEVVNKEAMIAFALNTLIHYHRDDLKIAEPELLANPAAAVALGDRFELLEVGDEIPHENCLRDGGTGMGGDDTSERSDGDRSGPWSRVGLDL
jgi:hypothetical protein